MEIEVFEIEKLSEFIAFLESVPRNFILSRGHSKAYELLPTAFRKNKKGQRLYRKIDLQRFLDDFQINSHPYISNTNIIVNDKEWMVYAQHYGVPTKLLDFTYSHVISLMFALENAFNENDPEDGEIWFLDPCALNEKSTDRSSCKVLNISIQSEELDKASGPIAVTCKKIHERIQAQNGLFVYFQEENSMMSLQNYADGNILKRVVIKKDYKKEILKSLSALGIGYSSLYPELGSVSKDIMLKRNIEEYVKMSEE
ncbi:FRG domain-containing protein [Acinetobacter sp. CFCC 10889]|uniref:FRG domain-containing protein n=1 Tax=Acinetobacter sp. CFCC 10889 TaxID=1775557 RepID=UPI000DD0ACD3|nr:FRG domain-containing protein [Acinetobacter sp. CFCC 10889]